MRLLARHWLRGPSGCDDARGGRATRISRTVPMTPRPTDHARSAPAAAPRARDWHLDEQALDLASWQAGLPIRLGAALGAALAYYVCTLATLGVFAGAWANWQGHTPTKAELVWLFVSAGMLLVTAVL